MRKAAVWKLPLCEEASGDEDGLRDGDDSEN